MFDPGVFAADATDAIIRVLRDRDKDVKAALDAMHPADMRDLEERIKQAIWNQLPDDI